MSNPKAWKFYPLPPFWEEKLDPNTQLYYYIDHVNKKTTWTDPRSWYYEKDRSSTAENSTIRDFVSDALSDDYENSQDSYALHNKNEPLTLTCASNTNSIVKKFLNEDYDSRRKRSHKVSKSSNVNARKSTSRKLSALRTELQAMPACILQPPMDPETRSRDAISVDTGLKKKMTHSSSISSLESKSNIKPEKRDVTEHLKSVSESAETRTSSRTVRPESKPDIPTDMPNSTPQTKSTLEACETEKKNAEKQNATTQSTRPFARGTLYIQAKGPNRSLLVQRIPAKGPNPDLHKGHNPALVNGPNLALLIKNRQPPLQSNY